MPSGISPALGMDVSAEGSSAVHAAMQASLSPEVWCAWLQDAADVEFAVHSLAPNEAANGVAVSHGPAVPVPAADNTSAAVLPGAEVTSGRAPEWQVGNTPLGCAMLALLQQWEGMHCLWHAGVSAC